MQNNFSNKYGKSEEYIPLMFGPQNQYLPPYNPSFQPFPPRNENLQWPQTMQNIEMNSLNNLPHPMQFIRNSTNENESHLAICNEIFERLMKLDSKNAFTILKEFCEKAKLKLLISFINLVSDEKAPISFTAILTIENKDYTGAVKNSKMEAKIDTSKFTIMELLKNEAIALKFFRTYLEKEERKKKDSKKIFENKNDPLLNNHLSENDNSNSILNEMEDLCKKLFNRPPIWQTKKQNKNFIIKLRCGDVLKVKTIGRSRKTGKIEATMKLLPYLKKQWINRSQNMDYNNNNEPLQFIKLNNVNKNLNLDDKEYESLLLEYDEKVKNKDKPLCLEKKELDKTKNLEEKKEFLEKNEEILIFNLKYIKTSSITNKQITPNFSEYLWDLDENNFQASKEDIENLTKIYLKIKEFQSHFEIFGIIEIIPVGSFILNCLRNNNLVIDLIAIKEDNIDNIQLSKEEILKSVSVVINKYSKDNVKLEALVVKNEIKPYLDIRIHLKENVKYKARIILKKLKNQKEYCGTIHHHYWIAQYITSIKRSLELQLLMRVLRKWREEQKLFNLRPEIIDLILFNVTNSFDWRTAVDINKIIWEFFNIFSRLETVEQLCNKLFYYGECHKKMIEKISRKLLEELKEKALISLKSEEKFVNS